jgi:CubicO group peptidase (beta-lactamase class C family)
VIVERVSGKSLRQFADEAIFKPLGMTHTLYRDNVKITIPNLAVGYVINPDGSRDPQRLRYQLYTLVGEGGLYTTLDDLFKWDQNFYHNQLGKKDPHLINKMIATQALNNGEPNNYAFGLVVMGYRGMTEIEHGGGWFGYRSDIARFPEKELTVIELCNFYSNKDSEVQELSLQVADLFLGK